MISLHELAFSGDVAGLLAALPTSAGVGQILGPERSLLIAAPANLRRWAASNLGAGPPPPKGKRPRTDLSPVTRAVLFVVSTSPFHQRLTYERLMARQVPASARRDLKPPLFLHLDPHERFPRLTLCKDPSDLAFCHGPFRDRRAAEKALAALHKFVPLRPCDYVFEPDPGLALGLSCLFAQVRSCAAPCLVRSTEEEYRALAWSALEVLTRPESRPPDLVAAIPATVAPADGTGLVIAVTKDAVEVYPVEAGAVLEEGRVVAPEESLDEALRKLRWGPPPAARRDWPWLTAWFASPRGRRSYVAVPAGAQPGPLVRAHLRA
jgi:DNA polymerase III subunit epsilon